MLLARINQVEYWRLFSQTHEHYNNVQRILTQKLFTKVIKNEKPQGLGWDGIDLLIKRGGEQELKKGCKIDS